MFGKNNCFLSNYLPGFKNKVRLTDTKWSGKHKLRKSIAFQDGNDVAFDFGGNAVGRIFR